MTRNGAGWVPLLLTLAIISLAGPASARSPACMYASRSYSDGAVVCVQKLLMMMCQADRVRPTWTVVTEKEMTDRCVTSTASFQRHLSLRVNYRSRNVSVGGSRCFNFDGRLYCE